MGQRYPSDVFLHRQWPVVVTTNLSCQKRFTLSSPLALPISSFFSPRFRLERFYSGKSFTVRRFAFVAMSSTTFTTYVARVDVTGSTFHLPMKEVQ